MTEVFDDICFRFILEDQEDGDELLLKWGVMQTPFEWVIALDGTVDRYNYNFLATDLDIILKRLREEPSLEGLHFYVVQGSSIKFKPNRGQQMLFKIKFCGEELIED